MRHGLGRVPAWRSRSPRAGRSRATPTRAVLHRDTPGSVARRPTCRSTARTPRRRPASPGATPITAEPAPLTPRSSARTVELDVHDDSLNLIRLGAVLVLGRHRCYLSGAGTGPWIQGENLGGSAVFGFFTMAGPRHREPTRRPAGRYLVLRVTRSTRRSSCASSSRPASLARRSPGPRRGATGAASSRRRPAHPHTSWGTWPCGSTRTTWRARRPPFHTPAPGTGRCGRCSSVPLLSASSACWSACPW